jgi:anti-anti-sigma factor
VDHTETLRVDVTDDEGSIFVVLVGDLDASVAGLARARIDDAFEGADARSVDRVIVDASGLAFCDSTGLSILVRAREDADRRGIELSVRSLSEPMRELLRLTGLDSLLERDG